MRKLNITGKARHRAGVLRIDIGTYVRVVRVRMSVCPPKLNLYLLPTFLASATKQLYIQASFSTVDEAASVSSVT